MLLVYELYVPSELGVRGRVGEHCDSGPLKPQLLGGSTDLLTTEAVWESGANTISNQTKQEKRQN